MEEGQAGQARQVGFEQHVAEPHRADPVATGARDATRYPHLSGEHRDLIDQAITHAAAQLKYSERTVQTYTFALRRLANDLKRYTWFSCSSSIRPHTKAMRR